MIHTMRRPLAVAAFGILFTSYTRAQLPNDPAPDLRGDCPAQYTACPGLGEPFLMCCPYGSQCIGLAGNTTKLCCRPDQNGCVDIGPITCDIQAQNATLFPKSQLSTSLLDTEGLNLPECLDKDNNPACCPFGYLCDPGNKNRCRKQLDQLNWRSMSALEGMPSQSSQLASINPKPTTPATSSATATSSQSAPTAAPTAAPSSTNTDLPSLPVTNTNEAPKFPIPAILAGFFPGLALGIFLALAILCFLGARRRNNAHKPNISSPSFQGSEFGGRSDFIRNYHPSREVTPRASEVPAPLTTTRRVRSVFRKNRLSVSANNAYAAFGIGLGSPPPVPPPLQPAPLVQQQASRQQGNQPIERVPSEESIAVFADQHVTAQGRGPYPMSERQTYMSSYPQNDGVAPPRGNARPMTSGTTFTDVWEKDVRDVMENGYVPRERLEEERNGGSRLSPAVYSLDPSPRRLA